MTVKVRGELVPNSGSACTRLGQGEARSDFLGFAIRRSPGYWSADLQAREKESWLPNRVTFDGPVQTGQPDAPSNKAPIQKFRGDAQSIHRIGARLSCTPSIPWSERLRTLSCWRAKS